MDLKASSTPGMTSIADVFGANCKEDTSHRCSHNIGESPHPHRGRARGSLDLHQDPDAVDELDGHVHQVLVDSAHIHLAPGDQEHIVGLQLWSVGGIYKLYWS